MSRMLVFGILGILLVLLGVMGFVVNPRPKAPPTAEEMAQKREIAQKAQEEEMKRKQEQMKEMIRKQQQVTQKQNRDRAIEIKTGRTAPQAASAPAAVPAMDITSDWYHHHPDGARGLAKLEAVSKAQDKSDHDADKEREKMFTGGDAGPGLDKVKHLQLKQAPSSAILK